MRLQLGRPGEVRASEIALQLPLPEPKQEFGAGALVERFLRRTCVQLGAQSRELRVVPARDEHVAEASAGLRVEVVGRELGQSAHERRMRNAGGEDVALQAVARIEESRCVFQSSLGAPAGGRESCQRLAR